MNISHTLIITIIAAICTLIGYTNAAFCSTFPALAKKRSFTRDRAEKSDGTFDFLSKFFTKI
jgi:hypothetical protein